MHYILFLYFAYMHFLIFLITTSLAILDFAEYPLVLISILDV